MTTITLSTTLTSRPVIGNGGGGGIPPANTVAPVISGTGVVGQTLSCSTGTWTGIPAPTYSYQWVRGMSDIPGATSSNYTLVQADATFVITCQVTATNVAGSASVTSSNSLVIDDADAQAFITAASITDTTQQNAINTLVVDLKGYGVWTKMKAIYPFVGGTATTHKFNLKDPRDLDVAFRLVFNGGWTHSSTGATPNGTNGFANTYLNPSLLLTLSSASLSFYSRSTNVFSSVQCDIGVDETSLSTGFNLTQKINPANNAYHGRAYKQLLTNVDANNIAGLHIVNRSTLNSLKYFRNGNLIQTNTTTELGPIPNYNIFIGSLNQNNVAANFSNRECAFSSIGDGLTDTEASNLYLAVQVFNTTLARQV